MSRLVSVFFLGGTISMATAPDGTAVSRLGPAELIESVPGLPALDVDLALHDFGKRPSSDLTPDALLALMDEASRESAAGVVVVQGTDTIEETAFLIDLLWHDDAPVVVTGAMRTPSMAGADGPANLLAAITVAAGEPFRGLGALVVLNDEVHAARYVSKRHTSSPAAFQSPNVGPLGRVVEGSPVLLAGVARRSFRDRPTSIDKQVPVFTAAFGDDGALLDGIEDRCDGLVIAGFGVGHVPGRLADRLGEVAARIPVVLASRIGAGPVLSRTYGAVGSEADLLRRGLVSAGLLDPYKARVLLLVLLAGGSDHAAVVAEFAAHSGL